MNLEKMKSDLEDHKNEKLKETYPEFEPMHGFKFEDKSNQHLYFQNVFENLDFENQDSGYLEESNYNELEDHSVALDLELERDDGMDYNFYLRSQKDQEKIKTEVSKKMNSYLNTEDNENSLSMFSETLKNLKPEFFEFGKEERNIMKNETNLENTSKELTMHLQTEKMFDLAWQSKIF